MSVDNNVLRGEPYVVEINNDSLFVEGINSAASKIYQQKKDKIYATRKHQDLGGKTHTGVYVWKIHNEVSAQYIKHVVRLYIETYLKKDNLYKLSVEYLFCQEPEISHWSSRERMLQVINNVIEIMMIKKSDDFNNNIEVALHQYLMHVLSDEHLYVVAIDYLINCEDIGGGDIFKDGVKIEIMNTIHIAKESL